MHSSTDFPLRLGSKECFARVSAALRQAGFDERTVCSVLKIGALPELSSVQRETVDFSATPASLTALIKAFLFGEMVPCGEFESAVDGETRAALLDLDLVRAGSSQRDAAPAAQIYSPVFFYPVDGFWVASDRQSCADGSPFVAPTDMVFAAIFPGTLRFLRGISPRPAEDALDLCSGTGIGALKLSRHARRAVAADITERSAHFMRFNAALNGCANMEVSVGDLYGAVEGRAFDYITAHPPYVPSLGDKMIFRDGGEVGETVLRRIVEGLPCCLRPGGRFYAMGVGLDTQEATFEERVRRWLGDAAGEFDVLFAAADEKSPEQAVEDILARGRGIKSLDAGQLARSFRDSGALRLVYGALILRRHAAAATAWTARPRLGNETTAEDFDWWCEWRSQRERPEHLESLENAQPRLSPHLQVKVTHSVQDGALVPSGFFMESSRPFAALTRVDEWVVPLIARFDGRHRACEVHEAARLAGQLPPSFALKDFLRLLVLLVERGCLIVEPRKSDLRR